MTRLTIALLLAGLVSSACGGSSEKAMTDSGITTLQKTDVTVGSGAEAKPGTTAQVHYTGWLYDASAAEHHGKEFDSSRQRIAVRVPASVRARSFRAGMKASRE